MLVLIFTHKKYYYPLCEIFDDDIDKSRGYKAIKTRIYWSNKEEDGYKEVYMPYDWIIEITDDFLNKWSAHFPVQLYETLKNK